MFKTNTVLMPCSIMLFYYIHLNYCMSVLCCGGANPNQTVKSNLRITKFTTKGNPQAGLKMVQLYLQVKLFQMMSSYFMDK